jgi:hypothetical protein
MRRSVRCSCVRIPKALAFLRNGRYHYTRFSPALQLDPVYLSQSAEEQEDRASKGEEKNNHFVIPFSYL